MEDDADAKCAQRAGGANMAGQASDPGTERHATHSGPQSPLPSAAGLLLYTVHVAAAACNGDDRLDVGEIRHDAAVDRYSFDRLSSACKAVAYGECPCSAQSGTRTAESYARGCLIHCKSKKPTNTAANRLCTLLGWLEAGPRSRKRTK